MHALHGGARRARHARAESPGAQAPRGPRALKRGARGALAETKKRDDEREAALGERANRKVLIEKVRALFWLVR